jgi:hypothetical protein
MRDSAQSRAGSSASRVHRPSIAGSPVTGDSTSGRRCRATCVPGPPSESGALTATPGRSAHCCPDRRSRSTAGPRREPTYKADVGRIGWLLAQLVPQTRVTRVDAPSRTFRPDHVPVRASWGRASDGIDGHQRVVPRRCTTTRAITRSRPHAGRGASRAAAPPGGRLALWVRTRLATIGHSPVVDLRQAATFRPASGSRLPSWSGF